MAVWTCILEWWDRVSPAPPANYPFSLLALTAIVLVVGFVPFHGSAEIIPYVFAVDAEDMGLFPDIPASILDNLPDDASFDPATGILTWIQPPGEVLHLAIIQTYDEIGGWDFQFADMRLLNSTTNTPPIIFPVSSKTVDELATINVAAFAIDPDGPDGALRYSLFGMGPDGDTIDPTTGKYQWTPTESQGGTYHFVTIKVTDDYGASSYVVFGIGANEVNADPYFDRMPHFETDEHSLLTFPVSAFDPDLPVNVLTYSLRGAPSGATINSIDDTSGIFTWVPREAQDGSTSFIIVVSDGVGGLFGRPVTVDVREINEPPTLDMISAHRVCANSTLTFSVIGSDPDLPANTLTYHLVDAPLGATLDNENGVGNFSWTPHESQVGEHSILVVVSDGVVSADPQDVIIRVCPPPNTPPAFDKIPHQEVYEHSLLSIVTNATDPDGSDDALRYSLTAVGPDGATIDPITGLYQWSAESLDGSYRFALIRVTDDLGASDYRAFAIRILETDMPKS